MLIIIPTPHVAVELNKNCPFDSECSMHNVVYKATVKTDNGLIYCR